MDQHHDQTRPPAGSDPAPPAAEQQLADQLALPGNDRPDVWVAAPTSQPGCLSPQLARQLLDRYTQPGDVVLDIDDDVAVAATAAATGRRHHAPAGEQHLAAMSHAAGYLDLILLHWPRPPVNPHWLLRACRSLLGATGRIVVAVSADADADARVAHLNALTGVAATAGLPTIAHVAVFASQTATPEPHTDLLIFGVSAAGDE